MQLAEILIIVLATSLTSVYVVGKPALDDEGNHLLRNETTRVKRRHETDSSYGGYLEQCGFVRFPRATKGLVNVLAFLDSSWPYSHRQAIMLKMLNDRLRRSGLLDTVFFVVNVSPTRSIKKDNAEDYVEMDAWLGVSPEEIESLSDVVKTSESLAMSVTPDIQLIQDDEHLDIWRELRGSRDQVLVIDRCGKLTYQVIVPWSILHFPYVKAAILSTYKDEPCGPCELTYGSTTIEPPVGSTTDFFQADSESVSSATSTETAVTDTQLEFIFSTTDLSITDRATTDSQNQTITTDYTTTEDVTRVDLKATTILETFTGIESTDFTDTTTVVPISEYETTTQATTENMFETSTIPDSESSEKSIMLEEISSVDIPLVPTSTETPYLTDSTGSNFDTTSVTDSTDYDTTLVIYTTDYSTDTSSQTIETTKQEESTISSFEDTIPTIKQEDTTIPTTETVSQVDPSTEIPDKKSEKLKNEEKTMPIRIIMHAPHFHADGDSTRMHEYLVLNTGTPEHHRHLATYDSSKLYGAPQDLHEKPNYFENKKIESTDWPMKNVIYNRDESPGFFGEVADYWKSPVASEDFEYTDVTEAPPVKQIVTDWPVINMEKPEAIDTLNYSPPEETSDKYTGFTDRLETDFPEEGVTEESTDALSPEDEEKRSKLIAHYSKLLPWIYYVLNK